MTEAKKLYWIAINGATVARSMMPMVRPTTRPRAEQLVGFPTTEEATSAQQLLLTAPIKQAERYIADLGARVASGELRLIRPKNPEPPTREETSWTDAERDSGFAAAFETMKIPGRGDE
jgi:hypothetical protein